MNPIVYDASMFVGWGLTVAGAAVVWGTGLALLVAGLGLVAITVFNAMQSRR